MKCLLPVLTACLCAHAASWAGDFQKAFEAAQSADATYQAARAELAAARQNLPLARAGLLPNVAFSASDAKVEGYRTAPNLFGQQITSPLNYRAPVQTLSLRYPLFNREASQKVELARLEVANAEALFAARSADLVDRLANAYLQRLLTEHAVSAARAQLDATAMQRTMARRRFDLGEGTRPDLVDAEATLEMAAVLLREAQDQRASAALALQQVTGLPPVLAAVSTDGFAPRPLPGGTAGARDRLMDLLEQADSQNPSIAARQYAVAVAEAAAARNEAGHYPRLDLVASASQTRNESLSALNQSAYQRSLGLQFNLPLYSGGSVSASVTQALAERDKTLAELTAERQSVARDVTRFYASVQSGAAKIAAQQKAVDSGALALDAARKSVAAGLATQTDAALAQRKLAQTRREMAQTVYEYLLVRTRLLLRIGQELPAVVADLDDMLQTLAPGAP